MPNQGNQTLSALVSHPSSSSSGGEIRDVAVCWNYLAVVDGQGAVTKFGLVGGRNGVDRLQAPAATAATAANGASSTRTPTPPTPTASSPPGSPQRVAQMSATPRHLMICTEEGGGKMKSL